MSNQNDPTLPRPPKRPRESASRPLREDVAEIDSSILRLLLKRGNLLAKMRRKGRLESGEEKFLREHWQTEVSRVSRDPELSGRFFSLMQNLAFLPRPEAAPPAGQTGSGAQRREAFNLAPARQPVHIVMRAPLHGDSTKAWLYLAAAQGQPMRLEPTLQNNSLILFIKTLQELGAQINHGHDNVATLAAPPLRRSDIIAHVGDSAHSFHILLAHYLGRASRVKFTGDTNLKLADLSPLRHFLPRLGARLTSIVPKSGGLPARVECSGILPAGVDFPAELPPDFGEALLLAASFYESPFAVDFAAHPARQDIFDHVLPILEACGAVFEIDGHCVNMEPAPLAIPACPVLPMQPDIAAFLLAFASPLRGEAELGGVWPHWRQTESLWNTLQKMGLAWKQNEAGITAKVSSPLAAFPLNDLSGEITASGVALLCALGACAALARGKASLPAQLAASDTVQDFLRAAGLEAGSAGMLNLVQSETPAPVWNAPTPAWAMALALAACARPAKKAFQLGNPGILTALWPGFWAIYNGLPNPRPKTISPAPAPKPHRRIITGTVATPPELKEADWD